MRLGDKGTLFVSTPARRQRLCGGRQGRQARGQDHRARGCTVRTVSPSTTARSTSPSFRRSGSYDNIEANLDNPPAAGADLATSSRPTSRTAGSSSASARTTSSTCRSARPATSACRRTTHAQIRRMNLDGSEHGSRRARRAQHGRLRLAPGDARSSISPTTAATGSPKTCRRTSSTASPRPASISAFRSATRAISPIREFGWGRSCDEFVKPVALLGPHTAALGMRFYTGNMFPEAVPQRDLHRAARLMEPHHEDRRRHRGGAAQQGRHA